MGPNEARLFRVPTRLEEGDDCLICGESKRRGVVVALPFCEQCNVGASLTLHASCARAHLKYHVRQQVRPEVKHLICARYSKPVPPVLGYAVCTTFLRDLDSSGVPAGRCEDCNDRLDTRQGLMLHKNLLHPVADRALLSSDEANKLRRCPDLFQCPHTHVACRHCGHMDAASTTRAHEEVCGNVSPELRRQVHDVLKRTQEGKQRIVEEREQRAQMYAYERELELMYAAEEEGQQEDGTDLDVMPPPMPPGEAVGEERARARALQEEGDLLVALSLLEEDA